MAEDSTDLPDAWVNVELSQLAEVRVGRQRSPARAKGKNMRPYLRAANVTWDGISLDEVKSMDFSPEEYELFSLRAGDILLSEASGSASEVGKPAVWNDEVPGACFQNTLIRVRTDPALVPYLYWTFRHAALAGEFAAAVQGVGIHHLGTAKLVKWVVHLPPLGEQERIVAKIRSAHDRTQRARENLKSALDLLERSRQFMLTSAYLGDSSLARKSLPQHEETGEQLLEQVRAERREQWEAEELTRMAIAPRDDSWKTGYRGPEPIDVENLPALPPGWCWSAAEEIVEPGAEIVYGILQPGPNRPSGVPYVRGVDIQDGVLLIDQLWKTTPEIAAKYQKASLRSGDILLGIIRATKVAVVPVGVEEGSITQSRTTARFRPSAIILTDFLAGWLSSPFAQTWLQDHYRGIDMPGLNLRDVRRLPVPIAPLSIQKLILDRVQTLSAKHEATKRALTAAIELLSLLEQAILAQALRGQLATQEPGEAPIVDLLARIRDDILAAEKQRKLDKKSKGRNTMVKPANVKTSIKDWIDVQGRADASFDEIRDGVPASYEALKDAIFSLLDDPSSGFEQYFDETRQAMRFRNKIQ